MAIPALLIAAVPIGLRFLKLGGTLGTIANVVIAASRIYAMITMAIFGFWTLVVYFAKQIFLWAVDMIMSLAGKVLDIAGVQNPGPQIVELYYQLPPLILDLFARLNVMDDARAIFTAFAMNMALRSTPLIGGMFKG